MRFTRLLLHLRRRHPALRRTTYVSDKDIQWHGEQPFQPDWSDASRLIAFTLTNSAKPGSGVLYAAFNNSHLPRLLKVNSNDLDAIDSLNFKTYICHIELCHIEKTARRRSLHVALSVVDQPVPRCLRAPVCLIARPPSPPSTTNHKPRHY